MALPTQATNEQRNFQTGQVTTEVVTLTYTPEEVNEDSIRDAALNALATNRTYIAITNPTNAQNAAQLKALSRQMNGVIRLLLRRLDGTD